MEFPENLMGLAEEAISACRNAGLRLAVAESCSGGLIAGCLTAVAGASEVLERGFVVYSNQSKADMLGVPQALMEAKGVVSSEVACAMARGCVEYSNAGIGLAVTGIAGPGGASAEKPVGTVYIATTRKGAETTHERHLFKGNRASVRRQTVEHALKMIKRVAN